MNEEDPIIDVVCNALEGLNDLKDIKEALYKVKDQLNREKEEKDL